MKKLILLFFCIYFLTLIVPFPLDIFGLSNWYYSLSDNLTIRFGKTILGLKELVRIEETGSGDTTLNYVGVLLNICFSIVSSFLVWLFFGKRIKYTKLLAFTSIYARYFLAYYCISYGFYKVMVSQFPPLKYIQLMRTYGDSTPMGLFWTLMSASKPYTIFSGVLEVLAGTLLFFRRTKTFGAILSIIIMTQIVMINLCYDVPVKLLSMNLLLTSFFVLGDDIGNLFRLFVLHQPVRLSHRQVFKKRKWIYVAISIQFLVLIGISCYIGYYSLPTPVPSIGLEHFCGIYQKQRPHVNTDKSAVVSDSLIIEEIVFDKRRKNSSLYAAVKTCDDKLSYYYLTFDTIGRQIAFQDCDSIEPKFTLHYNDSVGNFYLQGAWRKTAFAATFKKREKSSYTLINTGFHWIQEQPNNQ